MPGVNPSSIRAVKLTIHNLKVEAEKEKLDHKAIHELYLDLQAICQFGFLNDVENKNWYKKYTDYIKEIALKEAVNDKERAEEKRTDKKAHHPAVLSVPSLSAHYLSLSF